MPALLGRGFKGRGAGSWEAPRAERQRQIQAEFEAGWAQLRRSWLGPSLWLEVLGWGALALLAGVAIWEFAPAWRALAAEHGIGRSAQDLALACMAAAVPLLFGLAVAFPRRARQIWS
jgi:hypothetical protein